MKTLKSKLLVATSIGAVLATSALAQIPTLTLDEFGKADLNGAALPPGVITPDPVSGIPTLAYTLPFVPMQGDVVLLEGPVAGGPTNGLSDILRFEVTTNGQGMAFFFSDASAVDPPDAPADVLQMPPVWTQFPAVFVQEVGPEGHNGALYGPAPPGAPGSLPTGGQIQYNIISDVPEPSSAFLISMGSGLMLWLNLRRLNRRG
jgi:hypothetical protein